MNAIEAIYAAHPWLQQLGIGAQLLDWTIQGYEGDALVGLVRQTEQYRSMFPAIRREDGTLRMNEAEYLRTQDSYRTLIFNYTGQRLTSPADFAGIFENDLSSNELDERLRIWDTVQRDGGDIRAAFYVYANMNLTDEDLYTYIVDDEARQEFDREYVTRTAQQQLTYEVWITRATEVGIQSIVDTLLDLRNRGIATDDAIRRVQDMDPEAARQMMDLLYHGGQPDGGRFLGLNELTRAFEFAMIGSAATEQGFALPSEQRIQAIRQAGIDRNKALEEYGRFAANRGVVEGMVARAGGGAFGQDEWEKAIFLRSGPEQQLLQRAQSQEDALGKAGRGADFAMQGGLLQQRGLRPAF
jgi:hypothetical protein